MTIFSSAISKESFVFRNFHKGFLPLKIPSVSISDTSRKGIQVGPDKFYSYTAQTKTTHMNLRSSPSDWILGSTQRFLETCLSSQNVCSQLCPKLSIRPQAPLLCWSPFPYSIKYFSLASEFQLQVSHKNLLTNNCSLKSTNQHSGNLFTWILIVFLNLLSDFKKWTSKIDLKLFW